MHLLEQGFGNDGRDVCWLLSLGKSMDISDYWLLSMRQASSGIWAEKKENELAKVDELFASLEERATRRTIGTLALGDLEGFSM